MEDRRKKFEDMPQVFSADAQLPSKKKGESPWLYIGIAVGILVVGFAIFLGIRRFKSEKRGEPSEDELSKSILPSLIIFLPRTNCLSC